MTATRAKGLALLPAVVLAAGVVLAGCIPGTTVTTILSTVGGPAVTASNLAFEPTTLEVTAGEPLGLLLINDDSVPHNLSIYGDASAADKLFAGQVVGAGSSQGYDIPALPAGTWYFRCDIHPDMHGTIQATTP